MYFPLEKGVLLLRDIRDALRVDLRMRSPKGICSKKKTTPNVVIFGQKKCRYFYYNSDQV